MEDVARHTLGESGELEDVARQTLKGIGEWGGDGVVIGLMRRGQYDGV